MSKPISKEDFDLFLDLKKDFEKKQENIINRITYVLEKMFKIAGYKGKSNRWTWYFSGAPEGGMGEMTFYDNGDEKEISGILFEGMTESVFGIVCPLIETFPVRYLHDDSFEKDVLYEIERIKKAEKEKKLKMEKRKAYMNKKKKVDAILAKERKRLMKEID